MRLGMTNPPYILEHLEVNIGVTLPQLLWQLIEVIPEGARMRLGMTNSPYILEHLEVNIGVTLPQLLWQLIEVIPEGARMRLGMICLRRHDGLVVNTSDSGSRGRGVRAPLGSPCCVLEQDVLYPGSGGSVPA